MSPMHEIGKLDAIDKLLCFSVMFLVLLLVGVALWSPNDGQTFQVISNLLTSLSGAFIGRLVPRNNKDGNDTTPTGGNQ